MRALLRRWDDTNPQLACEFVCCRADANPTEAGDQIVSGRGVLPGPDFGGRVVRIEILGNLIGRDVGQIVLVVVWRRYLQWCIRIPGRFV